MPTYPRMMSPHAIGKYNLATYDSGFCYGNLPSMKLDWREKQILIEERSGNDLTDYQVPITLKRGVNFDFTKAKPDGGDIRFFTEDGEKLPYWIEKWDSEAGMARVWVKVPSIPANSTVKLYMRYGNPEAVSESNGDAVFDFFDDFEDGILDTEKWNTDVFFALWDTTKNYNFDPGELEETGGNLVFDVYVETTYAEWSLASRSSVSNPLGLFVQAEYTDNTGSNGKVPTIAIGSSNSFVGIFHNLEGDFTCLAKEESDTPTKVKTFSGAKSTKWLSAMKIVFPSGKCTYYVEDKGKGVILSNWEYSTTHSNPETLTYLILAILSGGRYGDTSSVKIDYVFVAKYVEPEPLVRVR